MKILTICGEIRETLLIKTIQKFVSRFGQEDAFSQKISRNHCQSFQHN